MKHYQTTHIMSYLRTFIIFLLFFSGVTLYAQTVITYDISAGDVVIPGTSTDNYIIHGTADKNNTIKIESGYNGTITFKDLTISHSGESCVTILGENDRSNLDPVTKVNIILDGTNTITYSGVTYCAIQVDQGAQVHFSAIDPNDNTSGILFAKSTSPSGGAGIGAYNSAFQGYAVISCTSGTSGGRTNTAGGNVIISSGTITAQGGHAAGIGGAWYSYYNGYIIMYGGIVNASAYIHAAGIGSGCPKGTGVVPCSAPNSTIIALPPTQITATGAQAANVPKANLGLAGAANITYMNDPNKPEITVHTVDYEPNANIYLALTETQNLSDIFNALGIDYDLSKVKAGVTDASGLLKFRALFEQNTTIYTDASSSQPESLGRPYLPVTTTVLGGVNDKREITLPLLNMKIAFTDYPSTPLTVGYTAQQARDNAYKIKIEYNDPLPMSNVTFGFQTGINFITPPIFLDVNGSVIQAPTTLSNGDALYIVLPLTTGKDISLYSDVLLINGEWDSASLQSPIRKVAQQKVVIDDTGINDYIKVTASLNKFVDFSPATKTVDLTLTIDHTESNVPYDPTDVVAKYLITTEPDYNTALSNTPLSNWTALSIPSNQTQAVTTTATFASKPNATYYIHWYVESALILAHSQTVTDPVSEYGGFGPYIITDELIPGTIAGNPFVCKEQVPTEIKGEESVGASGDFTYQWQTSINGTTNWVDVGGNTQNYTPASFSSSSTFYRRLTIDNQYGLEYSSNVFEIKTIPDNVALYWKASATDRNWNNPENWVDAEGNPKNMIPASCTNVFIPGKATNFPSLHPDDTDTELMGAPACNEITFAYGAELAYQQKLVYEKAYIQYDFGFYQNLIANTQPVGVTDRSLKRDRWYPLAAPLKKIASGDFAFGGYPFTWQALPNAILNESNYYGINFNTPYANNGIDLSTTNNCIAVKMASYKPSIIGYDNHRNTQALNGILTIPYFEKEEENAYHPGHSYDQIIEQSLFHYFDTKTLQILNEPVERMNRGSESYRFIIENDNNKVNNVSLNGELVPCYTMEINSDNAFKYALIGNPLLSSIDMKKFYDINANVLDASGYYRYESNANTDGVWLINDYVQNNWINSFEGFVVFFKNSMTNQTLLFPMDGTYALTRTFSTSTLPNTIANKDLRLNVKSENVLGGDYAKLTSTSAVNDSNGNVRKLLSENGGSRPEVFYVDSENSNYNLIQAYTGGNAEINIGVRCSDTEAQQTLYFDNVLNFIDENRVSVSLYDQLLNIEQDLNINSEYNFKQNKSRLDEQFIDDNRFKLRIRSEHGIIDPSKSVIEISYYHGTLHVTSSNKIDIVSVYDIRGRLIHRQNKVNANYYGKDILFDDYSVYIIKVDTQAGESKSVKLID